jgi:SAM-dependent methyltransferase
MKNPNDVTAEFYDIVSSPYKGNDISKEEINLISDIVKNNSSILDIGCGSGRHLIPLTNKGFKVTGIDSSSKMLEILFNKSPHLNKKNITVNEDFLKLNTEISKKFDLIIMFWNTFNEICLSPADAYLLLTKCISLLNKKGKILINSDDTEIINPRQFDIKNHFLKNDLTIKYNFKTKFYDEKNKISESLETIKIYKNGKIIKKSEATIKQCWWTRADYNTFAQLLELQMNIKELKGNDELYILLEQKDGK